MGAMKVGIIAAEALVYQEQEKVFGKCGIDVLNIENNKELDKAAGLVLCGDDISQLEKKLESLAISEKILKKAKMDFPIICISSATALAAKKNKNKMLFPGIIDIHVQIEEGDKVIPLEIPILGEKLFRGVFKKNICLTKIAPSTGILCQMEDKQIFFVRQGNFLAAAFRPELADDLRVHKYFLQIIRDYCR